MRHVRKSFGKRIPLSARWLISSAAWLLPFSGALHALAQEPDSHATQASGGRRGPGSTREFLGLGPAPDPAAAKKGETLFKENCSTCHGENARGAQGPNLVRSVVVLHDENDEQVEPVIKNGRPEGGMPSFSQLSHDEIHDISQYLKLQVELAANRGTYGQTYSEVKNQIHGDPKKGAKFFGENCTRCHSATGDLAKVGSKYSEASVMQSRFIWPTSREAAKVTVTTRTGERITGSVLRLDDFDVAIRDANGDYHHWPTSEVKVDTVDELAGHRALLPKYTDADLHNITAFLETLK